MGRHRILQDADLLAVARTVFVEQGHAASTREIARRAGVSEAVIYQRYTTKTDFFLAAMSPPDVDLNALFGASGTTDTALHGLECIAQGMLAYFRELVPIVVPLMASPTFNFEEFALRHPNTPLNEFRTRLVAHLGALRERGEVRTADARGAALALFAGLFSLAVFERLGAHDGAFTDTSVNAMVRAIWHGLAPRSELVP